MQSHRTKNAGQGAARRWGAVRLNDTASRTLQCVGAAVIACAMLPTHASAQEAPAYTNAPVVVYAGPGAEYPQVASLQSGSPLSVMGCVPNYAWCDVAMPGLRGWVYGGNINYAYQGGAIPLMQYGPTIGLPIVGFSIGSYWGNYYRGRPWYNERDRWERRPPPGYGPGWHGGPGPGGEPRRDPHWQRGPGPEFHGGGPGPRQELHGPGPGNPGPGPRMEAHGPQQGHGPEGHGPQGHPEGGHGGPGPGGDHGPQH